MPNSPTPSTASATLLPYNQFGGRGGKMSMAVVKSDIDWRIFRANEIPGPGAYDTIGASETKLKGGRISKGCPKSDIDWALLRASRIPAPGDYERPVERPSGGRMSTSERRSDLDWKIFYAQQIPGPGAYETDPHRIIGGKLSVAKVPSDVEIQMMRASKIPGPGAYEIENCPILRPIGSALGGRISKAVVKSDIDWSILRAKSQPGPLDYNPDEHHKVGGVKISRGKVKSDVELAMQRASNTPGPGEYRPELHSISRKFGLIRYTPSAPSKQIARQTQNIPPEARRKPRSKTPDPGSKKVLSEYETPPRPHSSHGTHEISRNSHDLPNLKARSTTPTHWVLTQSAVSAYGVRTEKERSRDKPRKRRNVNNLSVEVGNFDVVLPSYMDSSRSPGAILSQASTFRGSSHNPHSASPSGIRVKPGSRMPDGATPSKDKSPNPSRFRSRNGTPDPTRLPRPERGEDLSDSARQLYEMAMKSPEFRDMMKMYTGVEDPSEIIRAHLLQRSC